MTKIRPTITRRRMLQAGGLTAAGALTEIVHPATAFAKPAVAKPGVATTDALAKPNINAGHRGLLALRGDLEGRLLLPFDTAFPLAVWPNAAQWAGVQPLAVAMCATDRDVEHCILWARLENIPVAIRSGGHNYAGFSTTPGLLIDVKAMNGVEVDLDRGFAVVQGGANNQDVASAFGGVPYAIPSGRCPTVGTSGLVLGGGWGFAATRDGLTCDSLFATDIVPAAGRKRTIDEANEKELFWAVRGGGGGNFGVHTAFSFHLHAVGEVTVFNLAWEPGRQIELMTALQTVQNDVATDISTRSKIVPQKPGALPPRNSLAVQTLGLFWGNAKQLRERLAPVFAIAEPKIAQINTMDYWSARTYLLTDDPNGLYDIRSRYVEHALDEQALDIMMSWMSKWPGGSVLQENMGIIFAVGGAVKNKTPDDMAYVHRNANYIFEMETSWSPIDSPAVVERQKHWLSDYFDAMRSHVLDQSYVNFPSRQLPDWAAAYYGSNLTRLSAAKRRYDPTNFFKFAQSIPLGA